jgi:hypothetical protein
MRVGLFALLANIAGVVCAALLVWSPEIGAYWVWPSAPQDAAVDRARIEPADALLEEIARQRLGLAVVPKSTPAREHAEILRAAERLLMSGEVQFPKQPAIRVHVPFGAANLDAGPPTHQLYIAGMGTVDLLLQAYRISADERFLRAAREEVIAFAEVDRRALVPRGFLWNDHALANRLSILTDFWQLVRRRADLDGASATQVLALAARTAERLAKPALFTYRSNHGVMQNVALLQYAAAFPSLESTPRMRALACARLKGQMEFYVSPEGPVLEHSAGYHEFGRYMLATSIRLFEINRCDIPPEWHRKLELAREFSSLLRRPDGSLPALGNTDYEEFAESYGDQVAGAPERSYALYPVSGFAVWWKGLSTWPRTEGLSQTVVTWSNYPSRAHKRADDMSVLIWAGGYSWLGNTGYWPYGAAGFDAAQGWRGSNAPHFAGEAVAGDRPARLRGAVDSGRVRAIELERQVAHPAGVLRRQIVDVDGATWLIADSFSGSGVLQVDRIWTTLPETQVVTLADHAFLLRLAGAPTAGRLTIVGQLAQPPELVRGRLEAFGGWIVRRGLPTAAAAFSVRQSAPDRPVISVLELGREGELRGGALPILAPGASTDRWQVSLTTQHGPTRVDWRDGSLSVRFADGAELKATLSVPKVSDDERDAIVAAYHRVAQAYPRFRDLTYYRFRITYLGAGLLVFQEAVMLVARRWFNRAVVTLRFLAAASWFAFGLLAALWYLS